MGQSSATPSMRKITGLIASGLFLVALVLISSLLVLPWILNRSAIGEALLQEFQQHTGHELSVEAWHVRIFPSIGVELLQAQLHAPGSTTPLLSADRLEIALQWLPLLEGRVVGKDLVINRPRVTVSREANGTWSLGGAARATSQGDSAQPVPFLQVVQNLLLLDGVITVSDEAGLSPTVPLQIMVARGTLSTEVMGRYAKLQVSGEMPQERDRAAFTFDGSLTQNHEGGGTQAEGDVRLHHINVRHAISAWAGPGAIADGLVGSAQLNAHLRLIISGSGYELTADDWRAELADLSMQGTATVAGQRGDRPRYSATLSAAPVMLTRLFSQLPSGWISPQVRARLGEYGIDGLVTMQRLSVSGEVGSGARPSLSGSIGLRNGRVTLNPQYPAVEDLSSSLSFDDAQVRVTALRAAWGPFRLAGDDLLITQWLSDPHVDVKISGTGPLTGLVDVARRIEDAPLLREVFSRMQEATGDVETVAHVVGTPGGKNGLSLVDVDVRLHHAGFRTTVLPLDVREVEAHIHASPTLVSIEQLEGQVGPAALDARGNLTWRRGKVYSDVNVTMTADAGHVWLWMAEAVDLGLRSEVEGTVSMQAAVTGMVEEPRFAGTIQLQSAGLRIPRIFTKPLHAPASIEFDGRLSGGSLLMVRQVGLVLPPVRIVGDGTLTFSEGMVFTANVSSGAISLKELPVGIALGSLRAGTFSAKLHMEGKVRERASWRTSGEVRFERGAIMLEALQDPIREAFVTLRFDQDKIQISRMTFHLGASDLRISGSIAQWAESPKVRLVIESSQIDVASFIPSRQTSSAPGTDGSGGKSWWSNGRLDMFLFADHVYYKKFLVTGLSSRVVWDHGLLTVERISGDTTEGHVGGQVKVRANGRRVEQIRGTFRANGIPVDHVLSLVQEEPTISGWLTTSGKLQTEFEGTGLALDSITSPQPIQVLVEDGRVSHMPVISTLLSVMNLPAVLQGQVDLEKDGFPLDRLKVVFSISHGVILAKELLLDSPILKISGTGRYDIVADRFDMVLATSPLGSYSAALKRIPLFGQLLAGDRQGFDTAIFELRGSANNPELRYLPMESLMTGMKGTAQLAFDVLVNAITLPQKAYSMVEEEITRGGDEEF